LIAAINYLTISKVKGCALEKKKPTSMVGFSIRAKKFYLV
jgi:hypothetical protein